MNHQQRQKVIEEYIEAYNSFDVEGMLKHLSPKVVFENIANGETNLTIRGIEAFRHGKSIFYFQDGFVAKIQDIS